MCFLFHVSYLSILSVNNESTDQTVSSVIFEQKMGATMSKHAIDLYRQEALTHLKSLQKTITSSMHLRHALAKHTDSVNASWKAYKSRHYFLLTETQRQLHLLKALVEENPKAVDSWTDGIGALLANMDNAASMAQDIAGLEKQIASNH